MTRWGWILGLGLVGLLLGLAVAQSLPQQNIMVFPAKKPPQSSPPGGPGEMTWAERAAQPGVLAAEEMSSSAAIRASESDGSGVDIRQPGGGPWVTYDSVKNAVKIFNDKSFGTPSLTWSYSLPYGLQFDANSDMWVQFDWQGDAGAITPSVNGGGFKYFSIDEGTQENGFKSGSCDNAGTWPMEGQIVGHTAAANEYPKWLFPAWYHTCNSYIPVDDPSTYYQNQRSQCYFGFLNPLPSGSQASNCIYFLADTWHTWTVHLHVGAWGQPTTYIDVWLSRPGLPTTLLEYSPGFAPRNDNPGHAKYGKVWLFPYDSNRTSSSVDGITWYRRFLIANQALKDPTTGIPFVPGQQPPIPNPTLTIVKAGTGTGTVTSSVPSSAINCGTDCTETIASGTSFTMAASATTGSFSGWSGGGCSGTGSCTLSLTTNTTVTATFTNAGQFTIADNGWLNLGTPGASTRYIPVGDATTAVTVPGTPVSDPTPQAREFGGFMYGNGRLFYYGGAHLGYAGNDVDVYSVTSNTWQQSYTPEVCFNRDAVCGAIYGGSSTPYTTPLNRPYTEHMFAKAFYNPMTGHFDIVPRGAGLFTYDPVARTMTRIQVGLEPGGQFYTPWGSDIAYQHALWSPELSDRLVFITSSGGATIGVYRQTGGTDPKYFERVGNIPAGLQQRTPYSTYATSKGEHLVLSVTGTNPKLWYWFKASTMTFTAITIPAGLENADEVQYDSVNDKLIAIRHQVSPVQLWSCTPVTTPVCTTLTLTGAPPSNVGASSDLRGPMPLWQYDPEDNVFWYGSVTLPQSVGGGEFALWAYRYHN